MDNNIRYATKEQIMADKIIENISIENLGNF